MAVNADKIGRWKSDVSASVDHYNKWFLQFAPKTYRDTRKTTSGFASTALKATGNLQNITPEILKANPKIIEILRMATAPPIARDRLIGLSGTPPQVVRSMERGQVPPRAQIQDVERHLLAICKTFDQLLDKDLFPWLNGQDLLQEDVERAGLVIADRLCGAASDPIVRNAQEQRQLQYIGHWLMSRDYKKVVSTGLSIKTMAPGTFAFRLNVPIALATEKQINVPIDVVVMPKASKKGSLPLLIEAKSAGDFTNTNKRRKEEAIKYAQLKSTYGKDIKFVLFLCGYFDSGYLGYEAAEGIDWVWEHRIDDLQEFGL